MAQRCVSVRRSRTGVATLTAVLAIVVLPTAALAVPVPAEAPTVAGPTAAGTTLIAFVAGPRLCAVAVGAGEARPTNIADDGRDARGACVPLPILSTLQERGLANPVLGGAMVRVEVTGTGVAAVEARFHGAVVAHAATVPSPLSGAAVDLRFGLLEHASAGQADELALLDATGVVRRARPAAGLAHLDAEPDGPDPTPGPVLVRGHRGTGHWTLRATTGPELVPTPLEPERWVTDTCLSILFGDADSGAGTDLCEDPTSSAPVEITTLDVCRSAGNLVTVLTDASVHRVVAVTGDGTRRAIALHTVPGARTRAGIIAVEPGVAVRRVVSFGAGGRVLQTIPARLPPAGPPGVCHVPDESTKTVFVDGPDDGLDAGRHVLRATDADALLCLAIDAAPRVPADCEAPPIDPVEARLGILPTAGGRTYVVGVVPAEVTAAHLTLADGTVREIAATPIPGYHGRYAAVLRQIAASVTGRVTRYALRDARGRDLQESPPIPADHGPQHVTSVLRTPGLPDLRAALLPELVPRLPDLPCLHLGPFTGAVTCPSSLGAAFAVQALCSPRRIVISTILFRAANRLSVRTGDGREIRARRAALPAAFNRARGRRLTAALVVLGAHTGTRRVTLHGPAGGHADLVLPPAANQCGYEALFDVDQGDRD